VAKGLSGCEVHQTVANLGKERILQVGGMSQTVLVWVTVRQNGIGKLQTLWPGENRPASASVQVAKHLQGVLQSMSPQDLPGVQQGNHTLSPCKHPL
jgi:hypothetical protein